MQTIKILERLDHQTIPKHFTGIANFENDRREWYLNGDLHREDGPAVEYASGEKQWWLNNEFLFRLLLESQPFTLLEESEDNSEIKVDTPNGIETWPNLPGLKQLAKNWAAT